MLCMRFMHHLFYAEDRERALREFHRVVKKGEVISVWTDSGWFGLSTGRRRLAKQTRRTFQRGFGHRVCVAAEVLEWEFAHAGFNVVWQQDFLPGFSMWRVYALLKR